MAVLWFQMPIFLEQNDERLCEAQDFSSKKIEGQGKDEKLGLLKGSAAPGKERCAFKVPEGTLVRNGTEDRHVLVFEEEGGSKTSKALRIGMIVDLTDVTGILEP